MLLNFPRQDHKEGYVDVLGARVHYLHAGSGRPLLLVHGLVGSTSNWGSNIDVLAQSASVYAIDLVNMGKSQRIAAIDAGLEATADRIAACMDVLGLAQADIAAHSHGGAVAMMLAARHPERVRSLILFAPANPYSNFGDFLLRFYNTAPGKLFARAVPYLPTPLQRYGLGRMFGDPVRVGRNCLRGYIDGLRVKGTIPHILQIVRRWRADMVKLKDALPRIASIPTLLVWGDRDRAVDPASASRLQRYLVRSELRVLRGGGHVVFEEMPEESNGLMLDWLRRDLAAGPVIAATGDPAAAGAIEATQPAWPRRPASTVAASAKTSLVS